MSARLYNIMIQIVKDEPFMIVRGVSDMNGAEALRRLAQEYRPTTPATALTDLSHVPAALETPAGARGEDGGGTGRFESTRSAGSTARSCERKCRLSHSAGCCRWISAT